MDRVIKFNIAFAILQFVMDLFFVISWTKFVRKRNLNKSLYIILWLASAIAAIILCYSLYIKFSHIIPSYSEKILILIINIWFIPKLFISPVIIFKDLIKIIRKKFKNRTSTVKLKEANPIDLKRRQLVENIGWCMSGVPFILLTDGYFKTTKNYKIYEIEIPLQWLPPELDGIKIVQISDIHAASLYSSRDFLRARFLANSLEPDIMVVTGDFINDNIQEIYIIKEELSKLRAKYGVFACPGNHEHYLNSDVTSILYKEIESAGIKMLINENITFNIKGEKLQLAGVDNTGKSMYFADFDAAMKGLSPAYPTILLCHDPSNWEPSIVGKTFAGLTLAGHTHGGQIGLELFGEMLTPTRVQYKQYAGLYHSKGQYLYVNRGIGTTGPPIRVGIKPEIT
ncbi:MAG: Metallophosphoesterase, partial [Bacteroidota bacterium]|nr:Metallophosphoesterase [Bacteroidota bacterium]